MSTKIGFPKTESFSWQVYVERTRGELIYLGQNNDSLYYNLGWGQDKTANFENGTKPPISKMRQNSRFRISDVAGRVGGNIILLMLEFNSFSSSNFLSS